MAIKSDLIDIPLKGELNLSKNKLDVTNPADGGYLKNNGVLYGNILSPVYKQGTNDAFDYMDDNKNRWIVGNSALTKNNTKVMSYDYSHFEKETLALPHVESLYDEDNYISFNSNGGYTVYWEDQGYAHVDQYDSRTLWASAMYSPNTFLCVYTYASGGDTATIWVQGRIEGNNVSVTLPTSWSISDLTAPVLNIHKYTLDNVDYYVFSLISDSGSGVGAHKTINWCWTSANGVKRLNIKNEQGQHVTAKKIEKYNRSLSYFMQKYSYYGNERVDIWLKPSGSTDVKILLGVQELSSWTNASDARNVAYDSSAITWFDVNKNAEIALNLEVPNQNNPLRYSVLTTDAISSDRMVKEILWLDVEYIVENKTYTQEQIDAAVNSIQHFRFIPSISRWSYGSSPGSYSSANWAFSSAYYKNGQFAKVSTSVVSNTSQYCDAILGDGTIIQTQLPDTGEEGHYTQGLYNFTGTVESITYDGSYYNLFYTSTTHESVLLGQADTAFNYKYPYRPKEGYGSVSLGWNYYRNNIVAEGVPYIDEDGNEAKWETTLLYDSGFANSNTGVIMQAGYNAVGGINTGSLVQVGHWRVLYNNNLLAGISYSKKDDMIGTLVTDWLTVAKILNITENDVYYLNNAGNVEHIYISHTIGINKHKVVRNRYIIINTISYNNCYDLKNQQVCHWASDWNNRAFEGVVVPERLQITVSNDSFLEALSVNKTTSLASAQNANYNMTLGRGPSSAVFPPEALFNVAVPKTMIIRGQSIAPIDFYRADEGLTVVYTKSFRRNIFYKDTQLEGAYYPVSSTDASSVIYNPNIFTRFVETYNNNDMMISDGTAYPLMKYNGDVVMLALLTKGLENMQNVFVLQTLYYGIGDGKIWEIYYDNNTITNYQAIIDVRGMKYLGQLPTEALFWSPLNRSIYTFTGDAILKQLWHCNDISTVYNTFYNPATQELFISTNVGLLCVSNSYTYLLDDIFNVQNMFFYNDSFYVDGYGYSNDNPPALVEKYWKVAYEHSTNMNGSVHLATKYFGSIENQKIHINAVYVKLYNDWTSQNDKTFRIKETTITDKSTTTDYKTCAINWDPTGWGYIRYQPSYQKGSAISFDIDSDAPIVSMSVGYNVIDENAMIARNNI